MKVIKNDDENFNKFLNVITLQIIFLGPLKRRYNKKLNYLLEKIKFLIIF